MSTTIEDLKKRIERAKQIKKAGYSNEEISDALGISKSHVLILLTPTPEITEKQTIWYPAPDYVGRTDLDYAQPVLGTSLDTTVSLVQKRAQEDGEWIIAQGLVGDHEVNMRRMMEFVSNSTNIAQCVGHVSKNRQNETTVDWVCRELAQAAKDIYGFHG